MDRHKSASSYNRNLCQYFRFGSKNSLNETAGFMDDEIPYSEPASLMWVFWAYPILSFMWMAVNLYFIVHAIKTGRPYYWIWIIFVMPVLGAAAYFLVEMRPNLRSIDWSNLRWRFASPQTRISILGEEANASPTVKNRTRLAREYESQEQWALAAAAYRECLTGVFDNDPRLLICLASALLEQGEQSEAHDIACKIPPQRDFKLEDDRKLALFRSQSAIGKSEDAIAGLEELASRKSGLAPRFYLAQAKAASGDETAANLDLQKIIQTYRNGNALMRKHEQQWYVQACRLRRLWTNRRRV